MNGYLFLDEQQLNLAPGSLVRAHALIQRPADEIEALRRQLGATVSSRPLRQADDQTIVALAAMLDAARELSADPSSFHDWSVVSAPKYLGRTRSARQLCRQRRKGIRSVSPSIVPQHSLHSVSGAISVSLGIHGPNFGVGGGPGSIREGLLAAVAQVYENSSAGVWLVCTQWEPEPRPDGSDRSPARTSSCFGLAVALQHAARELRHASLTSPRHSPGNPPGWMAQSAMPPAVANQTTVQDLATWLDASRNQACPITIPIPDSPHEVPWQRRRAA